MKNNMKKIIVGILSFIILFTAQSAFAANWNSDPSDCQNTVAIANYTSNMGYGSCWTSTSMSAEPGDTINVRIYYHNTSNTVAKNVRLSITKPSNSSTSQNFTGRIMSDNGDLSGNVNLSISSSQSISFVDARWFPNQSRTQAALPNGQSASSILSNGILIGDVAPGWESQGTMVAVFKVSNTVVPPQSNCVIDSFTANPNSIPAGDPSNLNWNTSNCTSVSISSIGNVSVNGSKTIWPTQTTTYTLNASGSTGSATPKTVTVNVNQPTPICKINSYTASPTSVTSGGSSVLSWDTDNCTSVILSFGIGSVNVNGSKTVWPEVNTEYILYATGPNGSDQKSVLISVNQPTLTCKIDNFTANPSSITNGDYSNLVWNTSNCTSVSISPNVGSVNTSGSQSVYPTQTKTYTITASNSTSTAAPKTVTVTVNTIQEDMTGSINATGESCTISSGNSTCPMSFTWSTQNPEATSAVTHDGTTVATGNNGTKSFNISHGSQSYYLYNNSQLLDSDTVTASCASNTSWNGSYCSTNVVNNCVINSFTANPTSITSGNYSTLNWNTSNCTSATISNISYTVAVSGTQSVNPTQTTTYTLNVTGQNGSDQETVTVYVNQSAVCTINSFTANPTSITLGNSTTLSWSTSNCTSVSISHGVGAVSLSGSKVVYPPYTKTYILTAYGSSGGTKTDEVTVTVNTPQENMTGSINATGSSCVIASGNSTCPMSFTWSTQNAEATSAVTHDGTTVATGNNGTKSFNISHGSQSYYLYNNSQLLDSDTVTASCASNTSWNGSYCSTNVVNSCTINSFTANPTSITSGNYSTLNWNTSNCTSATISNISYNVAVSGTQSVNPTQTTTYTLNVTGQNGSDQETVTVYVNQSAVCTINSFTANPSSITSGDSATLNWNTSDCTDVSISPSIGDVNTSGSKVVYPTYTKTYTLTASGSTGGVKTKTVTVFVDEEDDNECSIDSFTASDTSIEEGDYTILKWNTTNCDRVKISDVGTVNDDGSEKVSPDEDITYTLTAYNDDGSTETEKVKIYVDEDDDDDNNDECQIDSFTASDTYIDQGDYVTLRWNTSDCNYVSILNIGNVALDGSRIFYPYNTTTYILRASGHNSEDSRSIKVNVDYNQIIPNPVYNTNVVTTVATNISQTGAQVNGLITSSNYTNANVYFEYGTTMNLGRRTTSHTTNGNTNFSEYLTNLSPKTIYYFQAIAESSDGVSRGSIEVFQTQGYATTNITTTREIIYRQGTTVVGSDSPIMLKIENRYQAIGRGDIIDYVITYKNISSSKLTNPMVQVFIPKGITVVNTSGGTYSENERTLSVPINDLNPNDEGVIYLQARVDSMDSNLAQIVTTTILIYTNPNGAQENAMAYVLNNPKISNVLGASVFFSGFFGIGLIGWLLIIIFILLLVLIARSFYGRHVVTTPTHTIIS